MFLCLWSPSLWFPLASSPHSCSSSLPSGPLPSPLLLPLLCTHHIEDGSRFLHPESLHHLEDVYYSLGLAALNGGCYGTEHPRTTHRVTVCVRVCMCVCVCVCVCVCAPVTLLTSYIVREASN